MLHPERGSLRELWQHCGLDMLLVLLGVYAIAIGAGVVAGVIAAATR